VTLERHVIVGANAVILPGVTIGEGSAVGALSLVNTSLPPWGIYAGTPARKINDRSRRLLDLEAEYRARRLP
jgi:galactoside O-acetyltransferase